MINNVWIIIYDNAILKFNWLKYKNFNNFAHFKKKIPKHLSHKHRHKPKRRKKSLFKRINHSISRSFKRFADSFKNKPNEYRPYLGPQSQDVPSSAEEDREINRESKVIDQDSRLPKFSGEKKHSKKGYGLKDIRKRWEKRREKRKKRKFRFL